MNKRFMFGGALGLVLLLMPLAPARADETGIAGIHTWVKVGRKTCLADHFHDASGAGPTRQKAQAAAAGAWEGFTAWEYGTSWGRYAIAASKSMECQLASGGGWSCSTSARACRPF